MKKKKRKGNKILNIINKKWNKKGNWKRNKIKIKIKYQTKGKILKLFNSSKKTNKNKIKGI